MKLSRLLLAVVGAGLVATGANAQELTGTLKKIKDTGSITVGHRESSIPFSYLDDKQQPVGYAMDLCAKIVDAVKAELKLPNLKVAYQPVTSANRIPLLQNGTIDMECGSTTNSVERQKQVSFGPTYFVINVSAAVKKSSGIKTFADLNGKAVASTSGTTSIPLLRGYEKAKGIDFKELQAKDHAESMQLLATDRAQAFIMDDILLAGQIANQPNPGDFMILPESLRTEPYGDDAAPGRSAVQGAGRPFRRGRVQVGRDRQDLRQVVHEPDPAAQRQPELRDDAGDQGCVRQPERPRRAVTRRR